MFDLHEYPMTNKKTTYFLILFFVLLSMAFFAIVIPVIKKNEAKKPVLPIVGNNQNHHLRDGGRQLSAVAQILAKLLHQVSEFGLMDEGQEGASNAAAWTAGDRLSNLLLAG